MHSHFFGHIVTGGRPLLYIADAFGILAIITAWLGVLPVVFTMFATFWASCYYLAMFYDSQLRRDISAKIKSILGR